MEDIALSQPVNSIVVSGRFHCRVSARCAYHCLRTTAAPLPHKRAPLPHKAMYATITVYVNIFPAVKSIDTFDFTAIPSVNRQLVTQLARCEYIERRENVIAIGNSGTGKTHIALGLGLAACQKGLTVGFTTASALVNELMEARDEMRLLNLQKRLSRLKLLIIDELGFVPLSPTGAELLFDVFSQRYERGSVLVTTNLPFDEWTERFGSERLTGALLDRLTHHVHIIEMNGDSYRLRQSGRATAASSTQHRRPSPGRSLRDNAEPSRYALTECRAIRTGDTPQLLTPTLKCPKSPDWN